MTTQQFLKDMNPQFLYEETGEHKMYYACDIPTLLKEFARIHVEKALEAVTNNEDLILYRNLQDDTLLDDISEILYHEDLGLEIDKDAIINCYPLSNII